MTDAEVILRWLDSTEENPRGLAELQLSLSILYAASSGLGFLQHEVPIKENPRGIPSLWYMPVVGGENFFDGFGFEPYRKQFGWSHEIPIDRHERDNPPQRPLLPHLEKLNRSLPKKWDRKQRKFVKDDDWLLWD